MQTVLNDTFSVMAVLPDKSQVWKKKEANNAFCDLYRPLPQNRVRSYLNVQTAKHTGKNIFGSVHMLMSLGWTSLLFASKKIPQLPDPFE